FWRRGSAFVGGLHEPGATPSDNVAAQRSQRGGRLLGFFVTERTCLHPRRAENGHTVAVTPRGPQAREVVDHIPQAKDGVHEHLLHAFLVGQAHPLRFVLHRLMRAHLSRSCVVKKLATGLIGELTLPSPELWLAGCLPDTPIRHPLWTAQGQGARRMAWQIWLA